MTSQIKSSDLSLIYWTWVRAWLHQITSFNGAFAKSVTSCTKGTLTYTPSDTWFHPFFAPGICSCYSDSLFRICLFSTFHLTYLSVLSRLCFRPKIRSRHVYNYNRCIAKIIHVIMTHFCVKRRLLYSMWMSCIVFLNLNGSLSGFVWVN